MLLVVVSTLPLKKREEVVQYLINLNAPVYLEAISGIREEPRLQHLRIHRSKNILENVNKVLRIGGVPTARLWRDLEDKKIEVISVSDLPFPGLSYGEVTTTFPKLEKQAGNNDKEKMYLLQLHQLFKDEPKSEPALLHGLSKLIPEQSTVYLGNSLPIREWDLAASVRQFRVFASRGLNGIDGQISTFLGLCENKRENWGIFGDLTTLYDMVGPWIIDQLEAKKIAITVINNGGGKIFHRMFSQEVFQNSHKICFESLAKFWKLDYERWDSIPREHKLARPKLIEIVPDNESTDRFWERYKQC